MNRGVSGQRGRNPTVSLQVEIIPLRRPLKVALGST